MSVESVELTYRRINELLKYDLKSGTFTWKVNRGPVKASSEAGCTVQVNDTISYIQIRVDGTLYYAHRLAFLLMLGRWPHDGVDHCNGDGLNNSWINLREVSHTENTKNQKRSERNTSGATGVFWDKSHQKWVAEIQANGEKRRIGYTNDFAEAVVMRQSAEAEHGFHLNHGKPVEDRKEYNHEH